MNPQAKEFTTTCTSQYTDAHNLVLLQTAKAKVFNPHTSQPVITVRVLFDSGSQRSYITNKLKDALRLQPEQKQGMSIKTFRTDTARVHICEIVEVGMKMEYSHDLNSVSCSTYLRSLISYQQKIQSFS